MGMNQLKYLWWNKLFSVRCLKFSSSSVQKLFLVIWQNSKVYQLGILLIAKLGLSTILI